MNSIKLTSLSSNIILLAVLLVASPAFAFGPCNPIFPTGVSYLPTTDACDGAAAVVLFSKYRDSFSAVVRDCNNNDRDPCNTQEGSCGSNGSSPFKAQKIVKATITRLGKRFRARIFCLKERGDSEVYKLVRRITIKIKDPVTSPSDVAKICLRDRTISVRAVEILNVGQQKTISSSGYSPVCADQPYLACSVAYQDICK